MNACPECGKKLTRVSRDLWERLTCRKIYACTCGATRTVEPRPMYSAVARCPRCARTDLRRRTKRDGIDRILRNPFRILSMMLGGTLYHCEFCRLQFHDLRSRRRQEANTADTRQQLSRERRAV